MKPLTSLGVILIFVCLLGIKADQATAEGFIFVSAGAAFTDDSDLDFDGIVVIPDVPFEDSASVDFGGGGFWSVLDVLDLGVQGSIGYFNPAVELGGGIDDLEFDLVPISILGMARVPLFKSDERPHGLIQPFAGIGPNFLLSVLDFDDGGIEFTAVGFDVGFEVRAGVNVNLTSRFGLFFQYKRTEVDATLTDGGDDLEVDFVTDHVSAGFGVHF